MKLRVTALGPLSEVEVPLRPLNVIIGRNQSGKTTLAHALYFAMQARAGYPQSVAPVDGRLNLAQAVELFQQHSLEHHRRASSERLAEFFQDQSGLYSRGSAEVHWQDSEIEAAIREVFPLPIGPDSAAELEPIDGEGEALPAWSSEAVGYLLWVTEQALLSHPFALPAERNALVLTYKLLTYRRFRSLRQRSRSRWQMEARHAGSWNPPDLGAELNFAEPVEAFLDFLSEEEQAGPPLRRGPTEREWIAQALERSVQGGHRLVWSPVGVGGRELQLQLDPGQLLDLHLAAGSIKQLAPLLLWLRSPRFSNGTLIIDEPEMGLHPLAQAKVVEALALIAQSGTRVFVTTHSADIMSHLNTLIAGSSDPQRRAAQARHLYLQDERAFLAPEDVGAWQLQDGQLSDLYEEGWGIRWDTLSEGSADLQQRYFQVAQEGLGGELEEA